MKNLTAINAPFIKFYSKWLSYHIITIEVYELSVGGQAFTKSKGRMERNAKREI